MKTYSLIVITALLAIVWLAIPCRAQPPAKSTPSVRSSLPALDRILIGKWKLRVRFEASPSTNNKVIEGFGEESWSSGPGDITLIEQEHIPSPYGDTFLMGLIWWDSNKDHLAGMECNSYLPITCDLKGGLNDISITWDGKKLQIDELETHNGRRTVWHEYWTDITRNSFTQIGDVTQPDGSTVRFMTVHGSRVKQLKSIGPH